MARNGFLAIAVIAVVMAVSLQEALGLRCWECNTNDHKFCGDPFNGSKLIDFSSYVDCPARPWGSPVCVKAKSATSDVIFRHCASTEVEAKVACVIGTGLAEICENCDGDGCNGAAQYGPVALLIALPVIFMRILSL